MIRRALCIGLLSAVQAPAADEPVLTLPIRFHITQGAVMTVKGREMEVWVKPADLTEKVLAEINRIWKPANIRFTVERARTESLLKPADFDELLRSIENAKRGEEEVAGSRRTANIAKLLDPAQRHPTARRVGHPGVQAQVAHAGRGCKGLAQRVERGLAQRGAPRHGPGQRDLARVVDHVVAGHVHARGDHAAPHQLGGHVAGRRERRGQDGQEEDPEGREPRHGSTVANRSYSAASSTTARTRSPTAGGVTPGGAVR